LYNLSSIIQKKPTDFSPTAKFAEKRAKLAITLLGRAPSRVRPAQTNLFLFVLTTPFCSSTIELL
jgi:hypothetical protein